MDRINFVCINSSYKIRTVCRLPILNTPLSYWIWSCTDRKVRHDYYDMESHLVVYVIVQFVSTNNLPSYTRFTVFPPWRLSLSFLKDIGVQRELVNNPERPGIRGIDVWRLRTDLETTIWHRTPWKFHSLLRNSRRTVYSPSENFIL